jgi:putative nucleotidyltransferase with HDIG domain
MLAGGAGHVLTSRVGRRVLALFLLAALVPSAVVSLVSSRTVQDQLRAQTHERLREGLRSISATVVHELELREQWLARLGPMIEQGARFGGKEPGDGGHFFRALALVRDGEPEWARWTYVAERSFPRAETLDFADEPPGSVRLVVSHGESPTLWMLQRVWSGSGSTIAAEIDPTLFWTRIGDMLPVTNDLTVVDAEGRVLYASDPTRLAARGLGDPDEVAVGSRVVHTRRNDGRHEIVASRPLFLKARFGPEAWTIYLGEDGEVALGPARTALLTLPFVALLTILVATFFSLVAIRRQLEPLRRLEQATKSISEGEYDVRVGIERRDEFGELARSFESMAGALAERRRDAETRAALDRAILSSLDQNEIVDIAIDRAPHLMSTPHVAVLCRDGRSGHVALHRIARDEAGRRREARPVVDEDATTRWLATLPESGGPLSREEERRLGLDECGFPSGAVLAVPIAFRGERLGALVVGMTDDLDADAAREQASRLCAQLSVALSNARILVEMEDLHWETLEALARTIDAKSPWTHGHSIRVTETALEIARHMGLPAPELERLHRGGLLHDIGKLGVPPEVLDKPGRLTDGEMTQMRQHTEIGARILQPISALREVLPIVRSHHERWDGLGYPDNLAGEEIPIGARILAVADVWDALSSERPYREAWSVDRVVGLLREGRGTHFDPRVVDAFLELLGADDPEREVTGAIARPSPASV